MRGIIMLNKGKIMKFINFGSYLLVPDRADRPDTYLRETKRLEWIFIAVRWLWVPIIFLLAMLHHPSSRLLLCGIGIVLGIVNIVATILNTRITTVKAQQRLGLAMLLIDIVFGWAVIFQFVRNFDTAAYAGFAYIIIEAAIRFGLSGSMIMAGVFIVGLFAAYRYTESTFGEPFNIAGYLTWILLMILAALVVGTIINEGRRQSALSERYLREKTLLSERHRMARELHDTVLKTLQGLSLEARALGNRDVGVSAVKETAKFIEDVCNRTSREIREVIFDLRSEGAMAGIGAQISKMQEDWSRITGTKTEHTLSGKDVALPPETTRHVRKIVSEALNNIQHHSEASSVKIAIGTSEEEVHIRISDNGHGIGRNIDDLSAFVTEGRLGIAGMRERAELLSGHLTISSDQNGTQVYFNVPIPKLSLERTTDEPDTDINSR
jgi:signal transduction histidine kinase